MTKGFWRNHGTCLYPDVVSDAADGDSCVSGQKKVFSHFFSQSHRTKSVQITEDHLSLCPVSFTYIKKTQIIIIFLLCF